MIGIDRLLHTATQLSIDINSLSHPSEIPGNLVLTNQLHETTGIGEKLRRAFDCWNRPQAVAETCPVEHLAIGRSAPGSWFDVPDRMILPEIGAVFLIFDFQMDHWNYWEIHGAFVNSWHFTGWIPRRIICPVAGAVASLERQWRTDSRSLSYATSHIGGSFATNNHE